MILYFAGGPYDGLKLHRSEMPRRFVRLYKGNNEVFSEYHRVEYSADEITKVHDDDFVVYFFDREHVHTPQSIKLEP